MGQLRETPGILHPVVFAGFRPTTCTCRALAYPCKTFELDGSHPLLSGMIDDLSRKLVVDVLHPMHLFALALLHCAHFLDLLQRLATGIEAMTHVALIAPSAKETSPF